MFFFIELKGNFYMVCDGDSSALYVYDGYNLVTVEGSGVSSVQNFLPFNHTGGIFVVGFVVK